MIEISNMDQSGTCKPTRCNRIMRSMNQQRKVSMLIWITYILYIYFFFLKERLTVIWVNYNTKVKFINMMLNSMRTECPLVRY